jgi:hypothetical protein
MKGVLSSHVWLANCNQIAKTMLLTITGKKKPPNPPDSPFALRLSNWVEEICVSLGSPVRSTLRHGHKKGSWWVFRNRFANLCWSALAKKCNRTDLLNTYYLRLSLSSLFKAMAVRRGTPSWNYFVGDWNYSKYD